MQIKTLFIKEFIENGSEVNLITRPRRFGKTLNMSMLKYFFDDKNKEENKKLFNGLNISKDKMRYQRNIQEISRHYRERCMKIIIVTLKKS